MSRSINRLPGRLPPTLILNNVHFVGLDAGGIGMVFDDSGGVVPGSDTPMPAMFKLPTPEHVREMISCLELAMGIEWPGEPTRKEG